MKKRITAILCAGLLFCTGFSAYAAEKPTTKDAALSTLIDAIMANLTEDQISKATDTAVDLMVDKEIMDDATFLLESITPEQEEVLIRLVFNIVEHIYANK